MRQLGAIILSALLGACVYTAEKMQTFVGKDVRFVELSYGPPSNVIEMGKGARAYQWTRVTTHTTPVSAARIPAAGASPRTSTGGA